MFNNIKKASTAMLVISMVTGCGASVGNEKVKDKELVISTYFPSPYLETVVKQFEKEHPDVEVTIEAFKEFGEPTRVSEGIEVPGQDMNPERTLENYITYLNTAFMGNTALDLLMLSWLPEYKYAQSGYLVDLTSYIEGTSQLTDKQYYMNVLKSSTYKENIYAIPVGFDVTMVGINEKAMIKAGIDEAAINGEYWDYKSMEKLLDTAPNKEEVYLQNGDANSLFHDKYGLEEEQFIQIEDKVVNFDNGQFIQLLKECKAAEDKGLLYNGEFENQAENSLFANCLGGRRYCLYQPEYIGHAGDMNYTKPRMNEEGKIELNATSEIAITKDAKDQALCWELIQTMLSEEMQKSPEVDGIPVNKNAAFMRNTETAKTLKKELRHEGLKLQKEPEEIANELKEVLEKWVSIPYIKKLVIEIDDVVYEETEQFFKGNKSAEEVAQKIQTKAYTMLNE